MNLRKKAVAAVAATAVISLSLAAGATSSTAASANATINIGASIPLSGPLAGFGAFEKWGYQHAVDEFNAAGGILVDGKKKQVKLTLLDDQTDPNLVVNNITRLITKDKVDALLGSCTDSLVLPGALIADRSKVPFVTPCSTTSGWKSAKKNWTWAWDLFFDSPQMTETPFNTLDDLKLVTNKKVAIIHSNGKNENVMGQTEYPAWAAKHGYTVVYNAAFPPDTSQFTSAIQASKDAGADIVIAVFPPPSAIALRKQMAAAAYTPKFLTIEEGGEPTAFSDALGKLAEGVTVAGYWDPSFPYPGAQTLRTTFEAETKLTFSQHIADTYAAAKILLQAIARAKTTVKTVVNGQIAKTDTMTVVGPIKFDKGHTSTLPMVEEQWQSGKNVIVWPVKLATAKIVFPMPN